MYVRIFRRSSDKQQAAKDKVTAELDFPEIASAKDPLFTDQHDELDALEERLANLQTPTLPFPEDRLVDDGISPSAGRINEIDLRHVISLSDDLDEDEADFERRFNAFANHSDEGSPNWLD